VTDAELVARLKANDDEAYHEVVARFGDPIYGYIYSITGDHHLSEDILSETYLRMVEKIDTYERGGLDIFGLPLTGPIILNNGMVVQYFERARFEFHPENRGTQYAILLGLLGVELGYADPPTGPPAAADDVQWYFKETGHMIARPFRNFWEARGGLALFGLPIGVPVHKNRLLVQYFERERLELHPDLVGTRYEIQLGHLGVAALEAANHR
jgi:hypothetical protein